MQTENKESMIYLKMTKIMQDVDAIEKEQKNNLHNYNFRGIDSVFNSLHPIFAKHGVFMLPSIVDQKREERQTAKSGLMIHTILLVRFNFMCEDGSSVECIAPGEGSDNGDKSINKAMSSAIKNALLQVFMIPTKEEKDSEVASPEFTARTTQQTTSAAATTPVAVAQPAAVQKPLPIDEEGKLYDVVQAMADAFNAQKINAIYVKLGTCQGTGYEDWIDALHERATSLGLIYDEANQLYGKPATQPNQNDPNVFIGTEGQVIDLGVLLTQTKTVKDFNRTLDFLQKQKELGKNVAIWWQGYLDKAIKTHGFTLDEKTQRFIVPAPATA